MNEFLAPMNPTRARDVLDALRGYSYYSPEGAQRVRAQLSQSYPLVFSKTEQKTFSNDALLIEMPGASISDPFVFVSHMDSLRCRDTLGRTGAPITASMQHAHVVALLEALEALLQEGYRPSGDLIIALSMDGLSGGEGARAMADHLRARGVTPCFVLDHGGYVTFSAFSTFLPKNAPLALVGITEKGYLEGSLGCDAATLARDRITKEPLAALLRGGARLDCRARRVSLCKASEQMLVAIAKRAPFPRKLLLAKPRLAFPLLRIMWRKRAVLKQFFLSKMTLTGASSQGEPSRAPNSASLSFQLSAVPGRSLTAWKRKLSRRLRHGGVLMETHVENEPSTCSQPGTEAWAALETAIEILFERAVIVPCLSPYVTDGRFYAPLRKNVCRFSPFLVTGEEAERGECTLSESALQTAVQFFRQILSM